jgi:DNA-binding NtrC family response regulator
VNLVQVALLEQDTLLRALLARLLKGAGYIPVVVSLSSTLSGQLPERVVAVVVDYDNVTESVLATLPAIPTILLSSAPQTIHRALEQAEVIEKPFLADEFLDVLARLIGQR